MHTFLGIIAYICISLMIKNESTEKIFYFIGICHIDSAFPGVLCRSTGRWSE